MGEASEELTDEEKSQLDKCDCCRDSYVGKVNENRILRAKFSKYFLSEVDFQSIND